MLQRRGPRWSRRGSQPDAHAPHAAVTDDVIHVTAAADRRFAMPLGVMVRSLLGTLAVGRRVALHVLDCGLSAATRTKLLASWSDKRLQVAWYRVEPGPLRAYPVSAHFSSAIYARVLAPRLLPDIVSKAIYLDADVLVMDDISGLWAEPWAGAACLAVQDVSCPWIDCAATLANYERCRPYLGIHPPIPNYRELGFSPTDPYFNSGVLVMNLDRWRTEELPRRAFECLDDHRRHVLWPDQYALNVVLRGKWRPLDLAWNQGAHVLRYPDWTTSPFDLDTLARCRFAPRIVHFTTRDKPWIQPEAHPFARRFFDILDLTAWSGWRPPPPWRRPFSRALRRVMARWG